jgi:hypothetical protein
MARNYNTFQALSATEVFVLQDEALSFLQLNPPPPPSGFNFTPFVPSFTFDLQEVVNFFAVPGSIADGQFFGPVYVHSFGLQLVAGPLPPPSFPGGPLPTPTPLPSVTFFQQPNFAPGAFQTPSFDLSSVVAFVLGLDGNLWFLAGIDDPFEMTSTKVDGNVAAFQALSDSQALVLGSNGNLWLENGPWGPVPPPRSPVAGNVAIPVPVAQGTPIVSSFQGLSAQEVFVLDSSGNLWFEIFPFATEIIPPTQIDGNVLAFQALNSQEAFVLGRNGNLWYEFGPWGPVPPPRQQVDDNIVAFQALTNAQVFVLDSGGDLWIDNAPWGQGRGALVAQNVRLPIIL